MKKLIPLFFVFLFHVGYTQPTELSLRLRKGETYHQHVLSHLEIAQEANGQQINVKMKVGGSTAFLVNDVASDNFEIEVRYTDLNMSIDLPQGSMAFSSDKTDENDIFSKLLSEMIKTPFQVTLSKTGKVVSVLGIDKMFENAFQQFPHLDPQQTAQLKTQLLQAYGESAFKGNIEMVTAIFPERKVAKGEKWIVDSNLESGFSAKMSTSFVFLGEQDDLYLITGNSTLKTADKDAYIESNGMPMRYDLQGTMLSNIKVNKQSGWITSAEIHQKIKGYAHLKGSAQAPDGMTIPMEITNEMSISDKQ